MSAESHVLLLLYSKVNRLAADINICTAFLHAQRKANAATAIREVREELPHIHPPHNTRSLYLYSAQMKKTFLYVN